MAGQDTLPASGEFTAGRLCLDFANTVSGRGQERECDQVSDYAALVAWCDRGGLLTEQEKQHLLRRAREHPQTAASAHRTAIRLRDALYTVFSAIAGGRKPGPDALETVNLALSEALANLLVVEADDGFAWEWRDGSEALERVLWPVARSAGELLTAAELPRVCQCADPECTWLFLDTSKNRSRRWCVMAVCGNRAKGRRHYTRHRNARTGDETSAALKSPKRRPE